MTKQAGVYVLSLYFRGCIIFTSTDLAWHFNVRHWGRLRPHSEIQDKVLVIYRYKHSSLFSAASVIKKTFLRV